MHSLADSSACTRRSDPGRGHRCPPAADADRSTSPATSSRSSPSTATPATANRSRRPGSGSTAGPTTSLAKAVKAGPQRRQPADPTRRRDRPRHWMPPDGPAAVARAGRHPAGVDRPGGEVAERRGRALVAAAARRPADPGRRRRRNPIDAFVLAKLDREGPDAVAAGRPADADPPADVRPARPAADAGGDRRVSSPTRRPTPTSSWSIGCSRRRGTASAGRGTGWTSSTSPRRTATTRTRSASTPGRTATTSSARSTTTSRTPGSSRSRSPATCCSRTTRSAIVALGFLAAGPWDESSQKDIRDDTVDKKQAQYLDRDDMVTTVFTTFASTTVHCARCHDHKFDPIPQEEYYGLQAVFAGVDRANRAYDADPAVAQARRELQKRKADVLRRASSTRPRSGRRSRRGRRTSARRHVDAGSRSAVVGDGQGVDGRAAAGRLDPVHRRRGRRRTRTRSRPRPTGAGHRGAAGGADRRVAAAQAGRAGRTTATCTCPRSASASATATGTSVADRVGRRRLQPGRLGHRPGDRRQPGDRLGHLPRGRQVARGGVRAARSRSPAGTRFDVRARAAPRRRAPDRPGPAERHGRPEPAPTAEPAAGRDRRRSWPSPADKRTDAQRKDLARHVLLSRVEARARRPAAAAAGLRRGQRLRSRRQLQAAEGPAAGPRAEARRRHQAGRRRRPGRAVAASRARPRCPSPTRTTRASGGPPWPAG